MEKQTALIFIYLGIVVAINVRDILLVSIPQVL